MEYFFSFAILKSLKLCFLFKGNKNITKYIDLHRKLRYNDEK